ncbi:hypothetical protein GL263_19635 [Streptomyces durbertensis]|uniref:DUF7848 domain-containing protein n=1 Tax=Streptomyces durbertensis TaxID=2448886 RepID=A0ABR6EK87_9ACTN|nr:hypothetical protein [Streptomyces durbertensis]MBB1245752.1 hypothetical protein [Streptomyces durbertensis]
MNHTYALRRFAVVFDTEPDAEPATYRMQCAVCDESGPTVDAVQGDDKSTLGARIEAAREASDWVRQHRSSNREHFTYRLIETHPYRLAPGEWRR